MEAKLRALFGGDCADLGFSNVRQRNYWEQRLDFLARHFLYFRQEAPERVGNYLAGTVSALISLLTSRLDHRQDQFFRWRQQNSYPSGIVRNSLFPSHVIRPRTQLLIRHNNVIMTLWKALIAAPDNGLTDAQRPHNSFRTLERTDVLSGSFPRTPTSQSVDWATEHLSFQPRANLDSREKVGSQS